LRKSWASTSEISVLPSPVERRTSFTNSLLAPLRNTFRSSSSARPPQSHSCSDSGHSAPSSDRASLSGLTTHLSPSTPNLSPSSPAAPPLPLPMRRWTASGQRPPATGPARTRRLSSPLPPPAQPIPPIPHAHAHVHFLHQPSSTVPMPIPIMTSSTDDDGPPTPLDDPYGLLDAAGIAASKARPVRRRSYRPPPVSVPSPTLPDLSGSPYYPVSAQPLRSRATIHALSRSVPTPSAIHSGIKSRARPEQATAADSKADIIDPSLSGDGHSSVRAHHVEAPTVSSLSSILPWLQDHDVDSIMPALANAE
jgi:hypothetical protein